MILGRDGGPGISLKRVRSVGGKEERGVQCVMAAMGQFSLLPEKPWV